MQHVMHMPSFFAWMGFLRAESFALNPIVCFEAEANCETVQDCEIGSLIFDHDVKEFAKKLKITIQEDHLARRCEENCYVRTKKGYRHFDKTFV